MSDTGSQKKSPNSKVNDSTRKHRFAAPGLPTIEESDTDELPEGRVQLKPKKYFDESGAQTEDDAPSKPKKDSGERGAQTEDRVPSKPKKDSGESAASVAQTEDRSILKSKTDSGESVASVAQTEDRVPLKPKKDLSESAAQTKKNAKKQPVSPERDISSKYKIAEITPSRQWQHDWKPPPEPPEKVQPEPPERLQPEPPERLQPEPSRDNIPEPTQSEPKTRPRVVTLQAPPSTESEIGPNEVSEGAPTEARPPDDLTPSVIAVANVMPPDAIKTVRIRRPSAGANPDRPIAPKILVLKKAPSAGAKVPFPSEGPDFNKDYESPDYPYVLHDDEKLHDIPDDKDIDKKLTQMLNTHRDYLLRKLKRVKKEKGPQYRFPEMIETLTKQGIPCPVNEDFGRLQGQHSRWDPQGTVLEYFSPMLRTFVPVNMRGRYRGCWNTDNCVRGLNISSLPPKRDALEGFVDRGRHNNIQKEFDEMSSVAVDEAHLDYLVEVQAYHAETLPIPIFYDMLHAGIEVANENLRILVQEEGYAPTDPIFISAHMHAEQLRRKIQMYGALGLETLESERKGLGQYRPEWLQTREELIRDIMKRKDSARYTDLKMTELEANEKGDVRRQQTRYHFGKDDGRRTSKASNTTMDSKPDSKTSKKGAPKTGKWNPSKFKTDPKTHLKDAVKKLGANKVGPDPAEPSMKDVIKLLGQMKKEGGGAAP